MSDFAKDGEWARVFEFQIDKNALTASAEPVTAHVPSYIPAGVRTLAADSDETMLVLQSVGAPGSLYVYRYYWSGDQKLQSAWYRWDIPGAAILSGGFIDGDLFLLVSRVDGIFVERIRVKQDAVDPGLDYLVHLDRRVSSLALTAAYSAVTNRTTYTLPYPCAAGLTAVIVPGGTGTVGYAPDIVEVSGNTASLVGDTRGHRLYFGYPYVSRYRFSPLFYRRAGANGSSTAITYGRLQVHGITVTYGDAAAFRIEVTPDGREMSQFDFRGRVLGDPANLIGQLVLASGRTSVPILARNDRVKIELVADTWLPCSFLSATWRGRFNPRSRDL